MYTKKRYTKKWDGVPKSPEEIKESNRNKRIESFSRLLTKVFESGEKLTWNSFLSKFNAFINVQTKDEFHGTYNRFVLTLASINFDGETRYATFEQTKKLGGHVKAGEKGIPVWKPKKFKREDEETGEVSYITGGFSQYITFNVRQTNLIEAGKIPEKVTEDINVDPAPIDSVMEFVAPIDFKEITSLGCPYFSPLADNVGMPPFENFHNNYAHAESLLHELIHWTGHHSRLDRLASNWRNKPDYSREELVACIGAALLLSHLGVKTSDEMELNQTAYLQSWIKYLENDIEILVDATDDAVKAANYLIKLSRKVQDVPLQKTA